MPLPEKFTTVTPFSKLVALFLFFAFPIIGFKYGMYYQKNISRVAPSVTPANTQDNDNPIVIDNGNLYLVTGRKLIVEPSNLNKIEDVGITKIVKADYSPDKTKILFSAEGGLSAHILFYADKDGNNIKRVGFIGEAVWSPNGKYIAFTQRPADIGPLQLYLYDTQTDATYKLKNPPKGYRSYTDVIWDYAGDIEVNYTETDEIVYGKVTDEGRTSVSINDFERIQEN